MYKAEAKGMRIHFEVLKLLDPNHIGVKYSFIVWCGGGEAF